jgi:uridine phosphorylase
VPRLVDNFRMVLPGGRDGAETAPLTDRRDHASPSLFRPENLLATARRQKSLDAGRVPRICLLDPDGDLVRHVRRLQETRKSECWACFHTELWHFQYDGIDIGVVGFAVGAPFAVMVAEQLFASGCEFLLSLASAGQVRALRPPPYYIVIERALRDEGTSYHYLPPAPYAMADARLVDLAARASEGDGLAVVAGGSWTTDAPYRETEQRLERAHREGLLAVEMEAAGLYSFAAARRRSVLCLAQITNCLGRRDNDFEKGEADGVHASLQLISAICRQWLDEQAADRVAGGDLKEFA